jgi:hypothetical protein
MATDFVAKILISLRGYYVVAMAKLRFSRLVSSHQGCGTASSEKFKSVHCFEQPLPKKSRY